MNFQQLRIIRETVRCRFNLTEAANNLFTSQSGVSKHIKDLEDELGVELYIRRGKRLLGLTEPGKELAVIVERMLLDTENIKNLAKQYSHSDQGQLTIATTHTQARYVLPAVVNKFKKAFPKVHLKLDQASPEEIANRLLDGSADIGIATETVADIPEFISFPYYRWYHSVIVPKKHPLTKIKKVTLAALAEYPIITYHAGFTGRTSIDNTFAKAGLMPDIVMSALDADVIKTYVELGMGIGIIAAMAFNPEREQQLTLLDEDKLFPESTTYIALRKNHYLRGFAYRFIELCAPNLTENIIRSAIQPDTSQEIDI